MVRQKAMCSLARPVGVGIMGAQVLLMVTGISIGWIPWTLILCGLCLAVIGHIGMTEWREYAKARFEQIESRARARGPDGSEVMYLTEDELTEVTELVGYGSWRFRG